MSSLRGKKVENSKKPVVKKESVKEVESEVKDSEVKIVEAVEVKTTDKQPNVRINPNQDLRTYIGTEWYSLRKGVQINVPQQVKDILVESGMLNPL